MKIVADTMLWVSYFTHNGGYRYRLINHARRKRVRFFVSQYLVQELAETLVEDFGRTARFALLSCQALLRIAKLIEIPPVTKRYVVADPEDDPIVQTGLSAKADYLVTADTEIIKLGRIQDLVILTPAQFKETLGPET